MTTASKIQKSASVKPQRIGVDLMEQFDISMSNVDRKNCIIKNVKILGRSSPNKHGMDVEGTDYLPTAHEQAKSLYESKQVNVGHPPRSDPDRERQPPDRNGVLLNIKTIGGETFGDWKLIPSHPMTPVFLDCASDPQLHNQFSLSHNAKGFGVVRDGRYCISEVPLVRSVDVVCQGATTRSLFESQETTTMKKTFKEILESALPTTQERFQPLLDLFEDLGDMPMDPVAAPPADMPADDKPAGDHMAHLGELLKSLVISVKDGSMSTEDCCTKIMAAIKVMEETKESPAADADMDGDADASDTDDKLESKETEKTAKNAADLAAKEAQELTQLRGEKKVRDLCESLDFHPTPIQIKALVPLSDADRKVMVKELKTLKPASPAKNLTTPRTATGRGTNVQESVATGRGGNDVDFNDDSEAARKRRTAAYKQ